MRVPPRFLLTVRVALVTSALTISSSAISGIAVPPQLLAPATLSEPATVAGGETATFYVELTGVSSPTGTTVMIGTEPDTRAQAILEDRITYCGEALLAVPITTTEGDPGDALLIAQIGIDPEETFLLHVEGPGGGGGSNTCALELEVSDARGDIADGGDVTDIGTLVHGVVNCASNVSTGWTLELCPADVSLPCELLASGLPGEAVDAEIDPTLLLNSIGTHPSCRTPSTTARTSAAIWRWILSRPQRRTRTTMRSSPATCTTITRERLARPGTSDSGERNRRA